jgi:hypothetical protein
MNAAFVVQGTLFFAGAFLVVRGGRSSRVFLACAAANAVGNVIVASVPSGPAGIPWVHATGATLAILGGNAAILAGSPSVRLGRSYRIASVGLAALGLLSFLLLALSSTTSLTLVLPSAVWERTSVYTIIAWQMLSAFRLLARSRD